MNDPNVNQFLKRYRMHPDQVDADSLIALFLDQMNQGMFAAQDHGMAMYPAFIDIAKLHAFDRPITIAAVDAGGTHLRIALVKISGGRNIEIDHLEKYSMLGRDYALSAEDFFYEFAQILLPFAIKADAIGISFAFPGEITNQHDMIIREMAKEIVVDDIQNKSLRDGLTENLTRMMPNKLPIAIVNDSVASLLSVAVKYDLHRYQSLTGLILGTGTNSCYREKCSNVLKTTYAPSAKFDLINTESGCFDGYRGGEFDHMLDQSSELPNDHLFEKMVGGKYLGELTEIACKHAQSDGLISDAFDLSSMQNATAKKVSEILSNEPQNNDERIVQQLSMQIVHRAQILLCSNLSALIEKQNGCFAPALLSIEGSTAEKIPNFKKTLLESLQKQTATDIECVSADHAVLFGTALAASFHLSTEI